MKKLFLVVLFGFIGSCFGNIFKVDPREEGMETFMGYTVHTIIMCDTKDEVLSLPLIRDRMHSLDYYKSEERQGEPGKKESWYVLYLLVDGMTAFIIHTMPDGTSETYIISSYDTRE